ncbi:PREDICTED: putative uncharacterized protein DDB_G0282499 [Cyphomyrmex costatus]|uniref:putative uncharacterized protein DDB_G0282499 n=1 Tax=Cyphomyrmex costatus TaxID=456900 RepID=UPI00085231EC|nr:PREDICTED: putative uncharacterized protein DDB_G0282499 [Cyphomyrmex costatus]
MFSTMILYRIFGCLLLILLSHADARKSHYLETILESLQRLENILVKQTEQNTFCILPAEKLRNLISEHQISDDSNENNIQYSSTPKQLKHQKKPKNDNENVNANINENLNTNFKASRHHRRSYSGGDSRLPKTRNQNMNSNINLNSNVMTNREDASDFNDEDEV